MDFITATVPVDRIVYSEFDPLDIWITAYNNGFSISNATVLLFNLSATDTIAGIPNIDQPQFKHIRRDQLCFLVAIAKSFYETLER